MRRFGCNLPRRTLVVAGFGLFSHASLANADTERLLPPAVDDYLVFALGSSSGQPVAPADVRPGQAPLLVWPMASNQRVVRNGTRYNKILLLDAGSRSRQSITAYSGICTHAGCAVSGWRHGSRLLVCPCHGSTYAADQNGAVLRGPASRRLPALQIKIVDGYLRVVSTFDARVGGDTSRTM